MIMVVGFLCCVALIDVLLTTLQLQIKWELLAVWNICNLVYFLLNIFLVLVFNFESYEWVRFCLLKFCYVENLDGREEEEKKIETEMSKHVIQIQEKGSNSKSKSQENAFKRFARKCCDFSLGTIYPFFSPILSCILVILTTIFFLSHGSRIKQKQTKPSKRRANVQQQLQSTIEPLDANCKPANSIN